ncbi:uncharacterized protein N7496_000705 [Penicillium cataractarum]|uniref:Uncharacterized protein n=1 Tax=Penicillium cataractarum TaxID=2100454 RepID=A0A9W9VUL1_9EURO|nr:uncharacterized protein N7496_000705 [Penicillium cataractarum]KAJ5389637.1 hypothetical protein N7496_000705 [Penicillium cataractarum]
MPPKAPSNLRPVQKPGVHAVRPSPLPKPAPRPVNPADIRKTKEYKVAARRWLSTIVALPIVMYTSWILYERIYGNKSPRRLTPQQPPQESSPSASSSSPSS